MVDMEKVIKGLTMCRLGHCDYRCPYVDINVGCKNQLNDDALALLREQGEEIKFLKEMQLRTVKGMDENELGRIVAKTLGEFR
jgi:hypothetical protein